MRRGWFLTIFLTVGLCNPAAAAEKDLGEFAVLALAAVEERAVIRTPEGELRLLAVGDELPGVAAVVREILPDRLVLEQTVPAPDPAEAEAGAGEPSRRLVWMVPPERPGGKSTVRYFHLRPAVEEPLPESRIERLVSPEPES